MLQTQKLISKCIASTSGYTGVIFKLQSENLCHPTEMGDHDLFHTKVVAPATKQCI